MAVYKYALYVIRRYHKGHGAEVIKIRVQSVRLSFISEESSNTHSGLKTCIENDIEDLNSVAVDEYIKHVYHVYYTLLGDEEILAKACRDALQMLLTPGSSTDFKNKDVRESSEDSVITPLACIMGLREVECTFRSLYNVTLPEGSEEERYTAPITRLDTPRDRPL